MNNLIFVALDIEGELDGAVGAEVGAGAVARVLHAFNDIVRGLEI